MEDPVTKPRIPVAVESDRSFARLPTGWRRLPALTHKALRQRLAAARSPNLLEYHELGRLPLVEVPRRRHNGRPLMRLAAPKAVTWRHRARAAWQVLRNRACAVRWG